MISRLIDESRNKWIKCRLVSLTQNVQSVQTVTMAEKSYFPPLHNVMCLDTSVLNLTAMLFQHPQLHQRLCAG